MCHTHKIGALLLLQLQWPWSLFSVKHLEKPNSSYPGCHLNTSGSFQSARNISKHKSIFQMQSPVSRFIISLPITGRQLHLCWVSANIDMQQLTWHKREKGVFRILEKLVGNWKKQWNKTFYVTKKLLNLFFKRQWRTLVLIPDREEHRGVHGYE